MIQKDGDYNITRRNFILKKSLHPTVYQVKLVIQKDGDYNITRRNFVFKNHSTLLFIRCRW